MSCDEYRKHELGEIGDSEFESHLQSCFACQKLLEQDARLLADAKSLRQPIVAPLLWAKIENSLRAEKQRHQYFWRDTLREQRHTILRLAAVLVLVAGVGSYFLFKPESGAPNLLTGSALKQVENKESEYEAAIAELERVAQPQLAKMDMELMLLYRDRLETIEAQIERCKEALATNPANVHIRRYLLAALQDKKETLRELLEYRGS
jgi:hypothetical protein